MKKLVIIDDVFPHPLSGFRYQEFTSILEAFPEAVVYTNGRSISALGNESIDELIAKYLEKYPAFKGRVLRYNGEIPKNTGLIYCTFLGNAYNDVLPMAEKYSVPFAFTLYPGGGFCIDNEESDQKLKAVCDSYFFEKVIVTQDLTKNYLIENGFTDPERIRDIFGVVIPLERLEQEATDKIRFGSDKKTLDICFVAHRYTEFGQDKGYDIFIDTAKELSKKYDFVRFHVVGPWDESIIDVTGITDITFYGSHPQEWFEEFYRDKDIILSPNVNNLLFSGSFDGFPTGCVTDAALRKTAMLLTDPLSLNNGRFIDGKELVIIQHSVEDAVNKIEEYIKVPEKLSAIAEEGYKRVKALYDRSSQITPRISMLEDALRNALKKRKYAKYKHTMGMAYRKFVPTWAKKIYRTLKKK